MRLFHLSAIIVCTQAGAMNFLMGQHLLWGLMTVLAVWNASTLLNKLDQE